MATYYVTQRAGAYTIAEIINIARNFECPIKFYDEQGFLRGTAYPNGEVQR